jgi:hypothetical protein
LYISQEQATLKAKQRMLREDWELFKAQRKLLQQKMWNKTARYYMMWVLLFNVSLIPMLQTVQIFYAGGTL